MRPSFILGLTTGIISLVVIIMLLSTWSDFSNFERLACLIALGNLLGIYGMFHHYQEMYYDFNPINNKSKILNEPVRKFQ